MFSPSDLDVVSISDRDMDIVIDIHTYRSTLTYFQPHSRPPAVASVTPSIVPPITILVCWCFAEPRAIIKFVCNIPEKLLYSSRSSQTRLI